MKIPTAVFLIGIFQLLSSYTFGQSADELVIFLGSDQVSQDFQESVLDEIKHYAAEQNLDLIITSIDSGAPTEVSFTPSIFYQNHLGRSLYSGRYKTKDRLFNFVRTARNAPRKIEENRRNNLPIFTNGRSMIATPIKITELSGNMPAGFDQERFKREALIHIKQGLNSFDFKEVVNVPMNARLFYTDYHPFLSEDGTLYISTTIYSMFSCVKPVYISENPIQGKWENRRKLFNDAARELEKKVLEQLSNLEWGDAITPISSEIPVLSWSNLGLDIPKIDVSKLPVLEVANISKTWRFEGPLPNHSPLVQFSFGAPIDHYSGEAKEIKVQLILNESNSLIGANGYVIVNTQSITMGDKGLDDHIFNDYLKVFSYPNATYEFRVINAPIKWNYQTLQSIELKGEFNMIGISVPITAHGSVQLFKGPESDPVMKVSGNFELPLKKLFGIDGPDGPSPARDFLNFNVNFFLSSAQSEVKLSEDLFITSSKKERPEVDEKMIEEKEYLKWKASNKIYNANGSFKKWDIENLLIPHGEVEKIRAKIVVDINSIEERSNLLVKHLKGDDFFDVTNFPLAELEIDGALEIGQNKYESKVNAKIKGKSGKVDVVFMVDDKLNIVKGKAFIEREKFGIGLSKRAEKITKFVEVEFQFSFSEIR